MEWQLRAMPAGYSAPKLVCLAAAMHPVASGNANSVAFRLNSGGNLSTEAVVDTSVASNTLEYRKHHYPTEPGTAATWTAAMVQAPLRARFGIVLRLEFYTHEDLRIIVERSAEILGVEINREGALEIASRSRGTPRIANRLLRRVRDYAQVRSAGKIDLPTAQAALQMLEVDRYGFDEVDRKLLLAIIEKYQGGPVGVNTLAAALAEEPDAIEEIYEPFLIQIGFLNRTPRGRVATQLAYEHFGITPNRRQSSLF
jgi:Holliday junction DNA helicase RuvB